MSSILTNSSAMVALQTMKGINSNLGQVQNEISTGKSVSSAKDNAAVWAISKTMESDASNFDTIGENLALGQATTSVAREAAESVTDLLTKMKDKIVSAQGATDDDKTTIQTDIQALKDQITAVVEAAQFNGINLVKGTAGAAAGDPGVRPDDMKVLSSLNRGTDAVTASTITVEAQDLTMNEGALLENLTNLDVTLDQATDGAGTDVPDVDGEVVTGAAYALTEIDNLIENATKAAASFGSDENQLSMQSNFVSKLSDALTTGIGAMVDADMEEASARLSALQVQQQLGVQALSIANQAPQSIMSLFR